MSSQNYFDLLGDDENEEPTAVITRATLPPSVEKPVAKKQQGSSAALIPGRSAGKPAPPSEGMNELKSSEISRGGRGGGRPGRGAVRNSLGDPQRDGGFHRENRDGLSRERPAYGNDRHSSGNRDHINDALGNRGSGYGGNADSVNAPAGVFHGVDPTERAPRVDGENWSAEGRTGRGGRGSGRGRDRGFGGDVDERIRRREFDRRSGSGFGNEIKRDGSGRGNWGTEGDQSPHQEAVGVNEVEKTTVGGDDQVDASVNVEDAKHAEDVLPKKEAEDEDNELTLDEYEKILEEKRKALSISKLEERKVEADKAFASMQLVDKKSDEYVFMKLGSEKEKKKKDKDIIDKEEKSKKTKSINEFLKPADGEKYFGFTGNRARGRGRGRESRGGDNEKIIGSGGRGSIPGGFSNTRRVSAPRIEDPGQFPNLGAK